MPSKHYNIRNYDIRLCIKDITVRKGNAEINPAVLLYITTPWIDIRFSRIKYI